MTATKEQPNQRGSQPQQDEVGNYNLSPFDLRDSSTLSTHAKWILPRCLCIFGSFELSGRRSEISSHSGACATMRLIKVARVGTRD